MCNCPAPAAPCIVLDPLTCINTTNAPKRQKKTGKKGQAVSFAPTTEKYVAGRRAALRSKSACLWLVPQNALGLV